MNKSYEELEKENAELKRKLEERQNIMTEQDISKYLSQKRLKDLLNIKFEIQKSIQPALLTETENVKTVYKKFFNVLDETIQQEIKYLNEF